MLKQAVLTDFTIQRPQYETTQQKTLDWLLKAHIQAEKTAEKLSNQELVTFAKKLEERILHVSCSPKLISKRGHEIEDYLLDEKWDEMGVYSLDKTPSGQNLTVRMKKYKQVVDQVFENFYQKVKKAPNDIIHVSCTGYVAPSGAQKIVSQKKWDTTITHCYHMGCYGSLPAVRMAKGFFNGNHKKEYVADIVHTELCSLHTDPSQHESDQLVSQSLFADGHIRYRLKDEKECEGPYFKVLGVKELIVPDSTSKMTWDVNNWGFQFHLSREVPILIANNLEGFLESLCLEANLEPKILKEALFAIHPGGPKILEFIQNLLKKTDAQLRYSYEILYDYGNMSSATLPHVWQKVLEKENKNPYVVSLAFGPGLSICGSILKMEG